MKRGFYEMTSCIHYVYRVEDDIHTLFDCRFSRKDWQHLPKGNKIGSNTDLGLQGPLLFHFILTQ